MFWTILLGLSLFSYEGDVARVRTVYGDAMILPYGADDWEYLFRNDVITEGDVVKTLEDSRLVFTFGRGNVVSLGEDTKVEVNALDDHFSLRLQRGKIRVMSRDAEGAVDIMSTEVYVYSYSTVRFQRHGAMAKVSVIRGEADVEGEIVRAGEMARIYPDGRIVVRREFHHDDFDRWASGYERQYIVIREVRYVPDDIYIGVYDLDNYGHWRYIRGYGWVWIPDVGPDWRPYYYGHWVFRVRFGWVWVSYEEWGWVPYHYGRWAWVSGVGWVWVPGSEWRGAWVVWYEGPSWVSWAPLDPYGRPIVYINYRGRRRWVAPVVDYRSFRKPVYRYKPPRNGVYKKPVYRTVNLKLNKVNLKKYEKPVISDVPSHIKPVFRKEWKQKAEKIMKNPQIVKKPVFKEKVERRKDYSIKADRNVRKDRRERITSGDRDSRVRIKNPERASKEDRRRNKKDTVLRDFSKERRIDRYKRDSRREKDTTIRRKPHIHQKSKKVRNKRKKDRKDREKEVDLMKVKVNNKITP